MSRAARRSLSRLLSILAVALLVSAAATGVAAASTRYASPAGGGDCTSPAAACDLKTAIQSAIPGDTVVVGTGTYTSAQTITSGGAIVLYGDMTQPRPVIDSSAAIALDFEDKDSTVSYLDVRDSADGGRAIRSNGTLVENVLARATGGGQTAACELTNGTLRDSVCAGSYDGVLAGGEGATAIRNVTAIAGTGWGVHAHATGANPKVTVLNTIARDASNPFGIWADATGGSASITVSYSNYAQSYAAPGSSVTDTGHQQTAAPVFVNADAFDYHEAASSPTIGAGLTDPADAGTLDFDREFRARNGATDIGADEFVPVAGGPGPVGTSPVLSHVSLSRTRFAFKRRGHKPKAGVHYGSSVRFTLSGLAHIRTTITKRTAGLKVKSKKTGKTTCEKLPKSHKKGNCIRWASLGSVSHSAKKGANVVKLAAKFNSHTLTPGTYRMTLLAIDANGHKSVAKTLSFRIVKG